MVFWKRIAVMVLVAVAAAMGGVVAYVYSGSSAVESWVGAQLLEIGGSYLVPELRFERLTYKRPRTILLDKVTLSSPDPENPGQKVAIFSVAHARLELTEIPRRGEPIRFSEVYLDSPEFRAIAAEPGGAKLLGYSNLVKHSTKAPATRAESGASAGAGAVAGSGSGADGSTRDTAGAAAGAGADAGTRMKLSDFLLIRRIEIVNGMVKYESRLPQKPAIWLDGINGRLNFSPKGGGNPGLYSIDTSITRPPAFNLALEGQADIDTLTIELAKLDLQLDLQPKNIHVLPSELQTILTNGEVTGQFHMSAAGILPLTDMRKIALQSHGELRAAQVAMGQDRLSVDSWNWEVDLADGTTKIVKSDVDLLGGELHLTGAIPFDSTSPAHLELKAANIRIQKLLRVTKPGERPKYGGNVAADLTFSAPLAAWKTQADGGGTISIREGRIANLPGLGSIVTSLSRFLGKAVGIEKPGLTDTADGRIRFEKDGVRLEQISGTSETMAFRGGGKIGFDRRLDLRFNAGPLELLQDSLGPIGRVWAGASDALAGYRVTGTLDAPQVSVEVGGGK